MEREEFIKRLVELRMRIWPGMRVLLETEV